MNWTPLGIEPTKDEKAITAAYRSKLSSVNPEDYPEEFKALRSAYEEALALARQDEAPRDESPVGLWMEKVRAIYNDFPRRIDTEAWHEILHDQVCIGLDTRPEAETALLRFFMEEYNLPQSIWILLDETFAWIERKEELYENYPRDFIDFIIVNGARYPATLPHNEFEPGLNTADCDRYYELFFQAMRAPREDLPRLLDEMDSLSEHHPHAELLRCSLLMDAGKKEEAHAISRGLTKKYPHDFQLASFWADLCADDGQWEEVEKICKGVLEEYPRNARAKRTLAESYAQREMYLEAKELMYSLMDATGGDDAELYTLSEIVYKWNEALLPQLEKTYEEDPSNEDNSNELAWCYLQLGRIDEASRICSELSSDCDDVYGYHNLCAKVALHQKEYEKAYEHLHRAYNAIDDLQPDGTEKTERRIGNRPTFMHLIGVCLQELGRDDEAEEYYEKSLSLAPDDPETLTTLSKAYYSRKDYQKAADLAKHLTEVSPDAYHGHFLLATYLYELEQDRDAYDETERALALHQRDLFVYLLKVKILMRNEAYDEARQVLDYLHENGISGEINTDWCEAQLIEYVEKDCPRALEAYKLIAERMKDGEDCRNAGDVYYRMAVLSGIDKDFRDEDTNEALMAILDEGLALEPNHYYCLDYKAWLYKSIGNDAAAIELYHKLEKFPRRSLYIEKELAELYYGNIAHHADKALHYYMLLAERLYGKTDTSEFYFYIGNCYRFLGKYDEAIKAFLKEQELRPDDSDGYRGLSYAYEESGDFVSALQQVLKQLELDLGEDDEVNDAAVSAYYHKIRLLRRLGRVEDALRAVVELVCYVKKPHSEYKLEFDICTQFGKWDKARDILRKWNAVAWKDKEYQASVIRYELLTGNTAKANSQLLMSGLKLSREDKNSLHYDLANIECDNKSLTCYAGKIGSSSDPSNNLVNKAHVLARLGETDVAKEAAKKALVLLDEELNDYSESPALYHTRKAMALAVLGEIDKAMRELRKARKTHLCRMCDFSYCKDADIFEGVIYELIGEDEKAMALYKKAHDRCPGEADFIAGINRMKKKGLI